MSTSSHQAKIITFYSFKGGSGRTMALANTAWIMASAGKSVLVVDWDLEAPGLHLYYQEFLPTPDLRYGVGILDMFSAFAEAANDSENAPEDLRELHAEHTNFERYRVGINYSFPECGRLDYIGPGRLDEGYANRLHDFDWGRFQTSEEGLEFLEALRARMRDSDYDYILIDSRTGFSDGAGICTLVLPDTVVVGLAMNRQAIEGSGRIAQLITRHSRPIELHTLPMRIDAAEKERLDRAMGEARRVLDPFLGIDDEDELDAYWGEVQIPYRAYFAYGEELAVMEENPRHAHTVLEQYVRFASRITGGEVGGFKPVSAAERKLYSRKYLAVRSTNPQTVTMLHAPDDQLWAAWISAQLTPAGFKIVYPQVNEDLPDSDYLLLLLSPQLHSSPVGQEVERIIAGARVGNVETPQIIALRVSEAPLPSQDDDLPNPANLTNLSESGARSALLKRFGLRDASEAQPFSLDGPRFPARRPDVWQVPHPGTVFTPRVPIMRALRQGFHSGAANRSIPQVLTGPMGVGKQRIALEYAYRFASEYDLVWWIPASEPSTITASLTALAKAVNAEANKRSPGSRTGEDRETLLEDLRLGRHCPRWLLVFDGAESPEAVDPFIPTGGTGHVLITSRSSPSWSQYDNTHVVDVFTPEESLDLLSQLLPSYSDTDLCLLATRAGHLPLFEEAAAAALNALPQPMEDYLRDLGSGTALPVNGLPPEYQVFSDVYGGPYRTLRERSPAAAKLLDLCSFMSQDGVGMKVVQSPGMLALLAEQEPALHDAIRLRAVLKELTLPALAVLDPTGKMLKIHRVVQDLVRAWMTQEERERTRAEALGVLASMVPTDLERDERTHWDTFDELDKHVLVSQAPESEDPKVRDWLVSQVRYRWFTGRWREACELGTGVLTKWRETLDEDHTSVLRMESQLGAAHRMLGEYQQALTLSRHATMVQRQRDKRDTYALLDGRGYAADLRAVGKFQEAFEEDQRSYSGLSRAITKENNETLSASGNLALSKFYMESAESAVRQDQSTFNIRRQLLGVDNAQTWRSYARIGTYYREAGKLDSSREHLELARNHLRRLLGADSHLTLWTLQSLGMTMVRTGEATSGLELLQDTHIAFKRQWGDRQPRTMSCRLAVAAGLHALERPGDAADYAQGALGHYEAVFGRDHPFTAICRSNLALYLLDSGRPDEAIKQANKAVHQLKEVFGADHRYTLVARMNRNNCATELEQGLEYERTTEDEVILEGCGQIQGWGSQHPITLTAMANSAASNEQRAEDLRDTLARHVPVTFIDGHRLATALLADPYRKIGADLEVWGV
ncbi:FxSxx-COOH system tetratricopeptide repeat protein [Streptomyces sp. NBC_00433]